MTTTALLDRPVRRALEVDDDITRRELASSAHLLARIAEGTHQSQPPAGWLKPC